MPHRRRWHSITSKRHHTKTRGRVCAHCAGDGACCVGHTCAVGFPVPADVGPAVIVGQVSAGRSGCKRKTIRTESRQLAISWVSYFRTWCFWHQHFSGATNDIREHVSLNIASGFKPSEVRLETNTSNVLRRSCPRPSHRIKELPRLRRRSSPNRWSRQVLCTQGFEAWRCCVGEGALAEVPRASCALIFFSFSSAVNKLLLIRSISFWPLVSIKSPSFCNESILAWFSAANRVKIKFKESWTNCFCRSSFLCW